jgi:hypothetical protein
LTFVFNRVIEAAYLTTAWRPDIGAKEAVNVWKCS